MRRRHLDREQIHDAKQRFNSILITVHIFEHQQARCVFGPVRQRVHKRVPVVPEPVGKLRCCRKPGNGQGVRFVVRVIRPMMVGVVGTCTLAASQAGDGNYLAAPAVVRSFAVKQAQALSFAPYENVKVLLLGQDPYPNPGDAHGLCFSVRPGVR